MNLFYSLCLSREWQGKIAIGVGVIGECGFCYIEYAISRIYYLQYVPACSIIYYHFKS